MIALICITAVSILATAVLYASASDDFANADVVGRLGYYFEDYESANLGSDCTEFGCFAADAIRYATETDFAILSAGMIHSDLPQGNVTWEMITRVYDGNPELVTATVSLSDFRLILEQAVSHITVDYATTQLDRDQSAYDGFLQISGFLLYYDASAPEGNRVTRIYRSDGTELVLTDSERRYTIAFPSDLYSGDYASVLPADFSLCDYGCADATAKYVADCGTGLEKADADRITVLGVYERNIVDPFPTWTIVLICLCFAGIIVAGKTAYRKTDI